ncbi:YciI family protein [Cellulomonas edaphi]|uniref:YciI family protein n=1 Tax=Cellulomonas edaphi TaxID=3053468 RepID=A0ABT7SAB1_9CELL|nr:YciI family protein [Cellulomons edaphi]MDM7832562.1 YciI family protein [Cellulomons edaphi]
MQFLMLVCTDPTAEPYVASEDNIAEWVERNDAAGTRKLGERLVGAAKAKTVRVRNGSTSVTDGPFAELGELIAGFDILVADTLEEAIAIAADHPMARFGQLEIRAFDPFESA